MAASIVKRVHGNKSCSLADYYDDDDYYDYDHDDDGSAEKDGGG